MAYFPNGTTGEMWEDEHCKKCVHDDIDKGCPVIMLHQLWNYEQNDKKCPISLTKKFALDWFIPQEEIFAGECKMFYEEKNDHPPTKKGVG